MNGIYMPKGYYNKTGLSIQPPIQPRFTKGYIPWNKYIDNRIKTTCDTCDMEILKDKWSFNRAKHHFCSSSCQQKFYKGHPRKFKNGHPMLGKKGNLSPNWKGGNPNCIDCGKKLNSKYSYSFTNNKIIKEKRKRCQSCNRKFHVGEKSWMWNGGKSFEPYPITFNKAIKNQIKIRDNYKCQICGCPESECNIKLDIHHIDFDKTNISSNNLICLCRSCHSRILFDKERWTKHLINIIRKENIYGSK